MTANAAAILTLFSSACEHRIAGYTSTDIIDSDNTKLIVSVGIETKDRVAPGGQVCDFRERSTRWIFVFVLDRVWLDRVYIPRVPREFHRFSGHLGCR